MRTMLGMHADVMRHASAFEQIARSAGGDDIVPRRASAARTRNDMIEGQVFVRTAILALEPVAQEKVEPREGRIARGADISLEGDDGGNAHLEAARVHNATIFLEDVNALEKDGLDRVLPRPQRQREIAERPVVGIQHQRGTIVWKPGG